MNERTNEKNNDRGVMLVTAVGCIFLLKQKQDSSLKDWGLPLVHETADYIVPLLDIPFLSRVRSSFLPESVRAIVGSFFGQRLAIEEPPYP